MTTIRQHRVECSICGEDCEIIMLGSSNQMGYPDLDLRPSEMYRSTMDTWMDECPHCGFASPHLKNEYGITGEYVESTEYQTCEGHEFLNPLSKRFYRAYMINRENNCNIGAFNNLLHCIWTCDDRDDSKTAAELRSVLVELMESLNIDENMMVRRADILRRSGQFERLIKEYEGVSFDEEILNRIVEFQIKKAAEKDDKCYTVEDVIG